MFNDSAMTTTGNNATTADGPTLASLTKMFSRFREKFPPSDMVRAYRMNGKMVGELQSRAEVTPSSFSAAIFSGLPVWQDDSLANGVFVSERADGTEVVHCCGAEYRRPSMRNPKM